LAQLGVQPTRAAFVLAVPDAEATARWWEETLGFERWLEPPGWVFLRGGACDLRLGSCPDALPPRELGDHSYFAYLVVDDLAAVHDRLVERDADLLFPPVDQPWGMREVGVRTPDGHRFMVAQPIAT
jgi:catechol 2,3-dioxygenase-like lactoylglutathione lyase family enzyme